jgi:hypothetical protein
MEIPVEKITDEQAGNVLGAVAAATIPDPPKKKSCIIRLPNKSARTVTSAPEADLISGLVHKIENLKESDAKARLFELEDAQEKTYFEIGGVLSVMQKEKWYDLCASLDEWVEKNTGMKQRKARALIQIYDAIVNSEVKWAQVKHIKWTQLRAIARVLNKENVDHWIGIASKHSKREINELVKKHRMASGEAMAGGSTGMHIRNFKLDDAQEKTIDAAIEKAKATSGTSVESAALELICLDYVGGQTLRERLAVLDPQALAKTFADVLNAISKDAAAAVIKSIYQNVTHDIALQAN